MREIGKKNDQWESRDLNGPDREFRWKLHYP
jgi:hypothetical protein